MAVPARARLEVAVDADQVNSWLDLPWEEAGWLIWIEEKQIEKLAGNKICLSGCMQTETPSGAAMVIDGA